MYVEQIQKDAVCNCISLRLQISLVVIVRYKWVLDSWTPLAFSDFSLGGLGPRSAAVWLSNVVDFRGSRTSSGTECSEYT